MSVRVENRVVNLAGLAILIAWFAAAGALRRR